MISVPSSRTTAKRWVQLATQPTADIFVTQVGNPLLIEVTVADGAIEPETQVDTNVIVGKIIQPKQDYSKERGTATVWQITTPIPVIL